MLKKIEIKEPGDSKYLPGEIIDKIKFEDLMRNLKSMVKKSLKVKGINGNYKASLQTESFIYCIIQKPLESLQCASKKSR